MNLRRRRTLCLALALPLARPVHAEAAAWAELARGGVAVLLRHAATEPGIGDPPGFRLDDCRTQRNLSAAGREQARDFGRQFATRGIRVERVLTSRWCRCVDTAKLAFPALEPRVFEPLNSFFDDRSTAARQTAEVGAALRELRAPANWVLVSHAVNIAALAGESVTMGEAVLVRPAADGGVTVVGRLRVG
ncbi:MAG: histidine phosphatase family protein [Betaproteobacteria bacterium]